MVSRVPLKLISLLVVCALTAIACGGADRGDSESGAAATAEPTVAADADGGADSGAETEGDGTEGEAADDEAGAGDTAADESDADETDADETESEPAAETGEMFGDMAWPCGPGDASGATDQGVTDDSILIGGGDDRGFAASLGLNKAQTDAIQALVEKCNELGGINGRQIEVEPYDAKLFEVASVMLDACDRMFMLVGEGFAVDGFGEETRVQCDLAHVPAWTVSAAAAHGPRMVQPVPNPADRLPIGLAVYLAETFPDAIGESATMFGNFAATIETKDKVLAAYPPLGFVFKENLEYNVNGEDDWTPFVLALKEAGIKHVYFTGSCLPNYQAFRAAAAVNNYEALYSHDANFYDATCIGVNDDGVMDNSYVRVAYVPLEERDVVKAVDDYATLLEAWGGEVSALGMQTTSAFMLWATAASACGSELTRECVLEEVANGGSWTGGGLHAPTEPAANESPDCGIVLRMSGTSYERIWPEQPGEFACDESWVAEINTVWVEEAKLDENRVSQQFTG